MLLKGGTMKTLFITTVLTCACLSVICAEIAEQSPKKTC